MAYNFWLSELSLLATKTQRNYKHYFQVYLDCAGIDSNELYEWQKRLLDDGDPRTNREVAHSVAKCIKALVDDGDLASGTAAIIASAVRSFILSIITS